MEKNYWPLRQKLLKMQPKNYFFGFESIINRFNKTKRFKTFRKPDAGACECFKRL